MKYDAFISYRREGGFSMAQLIKDRLYDRGGVNCYIDLDEDKPGQFDISILDAIKEAPVFIIILSKKAMDRCVNEDDWVRREYLAAAEEKDKIIIPIREYGFKIATKVMDKLPAKMKHLSTQQGVLFCHEYLDATVDKILEYMGRPKTKKDADVKETLPTDTVKFMEKAEENIEKITTVDMAFHAGSEWRTNSYLVATLRRLLKSDAKIRILVNTSETVSDIGKHMKDPFKLLPKFDDSAEQWVEFSKTFPGKVEVRIANVPLMHRMYIVRGETKGMATVKFYVYGSGDPDLDFRASFDSSSPRYSLYKDEFEYIWNGASRTAE